MGKQSTGGVYHKNTNKDNEADNPPYICINCKAEFDSPTEQKGNECRTGYHHIYARRSLCFQLIDGKRFYVWRKKR